jgi:hypothetical protein
VTSAVQCIARSLLSVAKDNVVKFFRFNSRTIDGAFRRDRTQLLCCEIFQLAAITPKGRTRAADYRYVTWF